MKNNKVRITGKIVESPEHMYTASDGRKIYKSRIEVMRPSGNVDIIPFHIQEELVQEILENVGNRITIFGEYRSYNEKIGKISHLRLYVFVKEIGGAKEEDENRISLTGFICKKPVLRKTPLGKEIADILLAVNREYKRSDYLPSICWYRDARMASRLVIGTKVKVVGMIQSRKYIKNDSELTAYEVSIKEFEVVG